ncbi:site-specific integrase [Cytobacillus dafuensis]|uniref:Core-binding (CB) domain-containing protein n=1 Tax=Cytobacillus dafuensis TaxID=1742359 RepID=A0A5B8Z3R9_CYTDA|nr:hypothetical protein [Cytobacillus dafuensis]QED47752.1 hypothetical protein FSZ17_11065 [Cytobacillus dafuensis]
MILPPYIEEFVEDKLEHRSPTILLNYVLDYKTFFEWLISGGGVADTDIKDVKMTELESLSLEEAKNFFKHIRRKDIKVTENETKKPEEVSVSRRISTLRFLFKYLTSETEITKNKKDKYPYLIDKYIGEPFSIEM